MEIERNGDIKMIKAIGFDVGHTLIKYNNPLNWQALYRPGLEHAAAAANITLSEDIYNKAICKCFQCFP